MKRPWIAELSKHEYSRQTARDGLAGDLEDTKERLVSATPEQVPGLQRQAQYLTELIKELDHE
ncbi:MAG: hypothetical protein ACOCUJ_01550 [Thiohalospira sp.]